MKKNKKKRQLPLLLLALLLISLGAYGTQAYFTDAANDKVGLKVYFGTVDVNISRGDWTANGKSSLLKENPEESGEFVNALPGDSFMNTFTVTNNGSLEQEVIVKIEDLQAAIRKDPNVDISVMYDGELYNRDQILSYNNDIPFDLAPGGGDNSSKEFKVTVTVAETKKEDEHFLNAKNSLNRTDDEGTNIVDLFENTINVEAKNK